MPKLAFSSISLKGSQLPIRLPIVLMDQSSKKGRGVGREGASSVFRVNYWHYIKCLRFRQISRVQTGFAYLDSLVDGKYKVGCRGRQVEVRVQRRVRMGMKDELGSPYILSPFQITWLFTCIYLVSYISFLIHNLIFVCYWNLLERSRV